MRRGPAALLAAALLALPGCGRVAATDTGWVFVPRVEGDAAEQRVETLLREELGLWMGVSLGVARDRVRSRLGAEYAGVPSTGRTTTFWVPESGYLYLYATEDEPGGARDDVRVCGVRMRAPRDQEGFAPLLDRLREALGADAPYKRTSLRAAAVRDRSFAFVDLESCPDFAPEPPQGAVSDAGVP